MFDFIERVAAKAFFCVLAVATLATCGTPSHVAEDNKKSPRVEWIVSVNELVSREHALYSHITEGKNESVHSLLGNCRGVCCVVDTTAIGSALREYSADFSKYDLTYGWVELEDSSDCDLVIYSREPLLSETVEIEDICNLPDDEVNVLVLFKFDNAMAWQHITSSYIGKRLAIIVNGRIVNAPVVNARIEGGNCSVLLPRRLIERYLPGQEYLEV